MERLGPLTSLRFFAAAAIVIAHIMATAHIPHNDALALGVSFFFVLSGFILAYNYGFLDTVTVRSFYVARIARIWPIHLLTLAACLLLFTSNPEPWKTGVLNAFLLQSWTPLKGYVFSYNGVSWSISVEMFFYLLFPVFVRSQHIWRWYLASLLILAVYLSAVSFLPLDNTNAWGTLRLPSLGHHVPLSRLSEFVLGIVAARLFMTYRVSPPKIVKHHADILAISSLILVAIFIATGSTVAHATPRAFFAWYGQAGCQFFFAALIFVMAFGFGKIAKVLSHPILIVLGEISFVTYMVHSIAIRWVYLHYYRSHGFLFYVITSVVGAYALSFVLHYWFEEPVRYWLMKITRRGTYWYKPQGDAPRLVPDPAVLPGK